MNYKPPRVVILALLLLAGQNTFSANLIPAWTRKLTPNTWKTLTSKTVFKSTTRAPFIRFPHKANATKLVKSTDKKFIYHRVNYSGVFDKAEKELLLKHVHPQATLGKLTYLHDKHAAFFNTIINEDASAISETAFLKHQETLKQLLLGLENYYLKNVQEKFASAVFSKEEIARLQEQIQPPSYLLSTRELNFFSQLATLAEQKEWVSHTITHIEQYLQQLLAKDTFTLRPAEFDSYYVQNMRLQYFRTLAEVLEHANQKRPSAIIRYKRPVTSIPGENRLLTDAQRAGYMQLAADTTKDPAFVEHINQFNIDYGSYAAAEALEVPYEVSLSHYMYAPELLGAEEGARLRKLSPTSCLAELTPKVAQLEEQLAALRKKPSFTPEFYGSYYRIYAKLQIYQALISHAKVTLELQNLYR